MRLVRKPYMKIDIPYYIRQVLREQRKVYVPGIGTFQLMHSHSQFSDDKSTLSPPRLSLSFQEGESEDKSLTKYIIDTERFSNKKIEKAIEAYTQSSFDSLVNDNKLDFPGLGSLTKTDDSLNFLPTVETLTKEYSGFKKVNLNPISRIKQEAEVAHALDTTNLPAEKSDSYPWWLYSFLAGLLIAALFVLGVRGCEYLEDKKALESEINETIDKNERDIEASQMTKKLTDDGEEVTKKYQEVDELLGDGETKVTTKGDEELSNLTPIKEEEVKVEETVVEEVKIEEPVVKEIIVEEPKVEEIKTEIVPEKQVAVKTVTNKYADIIPESGECIIILGSLKKASNIASLMSLIERDGKTVYRSQHNGNTRVGLKFDCTDVDIEAYLTDIRKRLSSKAWYLDPSVNIPYR